MRQRLHFAENGTDQIHTFAGGLDNDIDHYEKIDFSNITDFSHGHHLRAGGGNDIFDFVNISNIQNIVVGRIEDFDPTRDEIRIEGEPLDLTDLPSNVRIVEFNGAHNDLNSDPQRWLLIDTGSGYLFYALDGARIDMDTNGDSNSGTQERHFLQIQEIPDFSQLKDVPYENPMNYAPEGHEPNGGSVINDTDRDAQDVLDPINGTSGGDVIAAGLNSDVVHAGAGSDVVFGGDGWDSLYGGWGEDTLNGNAGADELFGEAGGDLLNGDSGNDTLIGGEGDDGLKGGDGDDMLFGGPGNDRLPGGNGNDTSYGGAGDDRLGGGFGDDYMEGGDGSDGGGAGPGNDTVIGGAGYDQFNGGYGNDYMDLGQGDDRAGASFGNDTMFGGAGNDLLSGGDGDDEIHGDAGDDTIISGNGTDTVSGGEGADIFIFNSLFGGDTTVITDFEDGIDTIRVTGLRPTPDELGRLDITDILYDGEAAASFTYADHTVIVQGLSAADLTADDFLFA